MKIFGYLVVGLALLLPVTGFCQQPPPPAERPLARFNLDFPGGVSRDLIAAIQKATGKPLNVIVQDEAADVKIPALKMTGIDVFDLFNALHFATIHMVQNGQYHRNQALVYRTTNKATDDSIWFATLEDVGGIFSSDPVTEKSCRFYLLTPYLDKGLTVDDITTAIQTGWKLLGIQPAPSISYHAETKLLIAAGEVKSLSYIDEALRALGANAKPPVMIGPIPAGTSGQQGKVDPAN